MSSGSFSKKFYGNYSLIVDWKSTSSISSNTSIVEATVKMYAEYDIDIGGRDNNYVSINGKKYYFSSPACTGSGKTFTLGKIKSKSISHNEDGNLTIDIKASFNLKAYLGSGYYGTVSASDKVALDKIPRQSKISVKDTYIEDTAVITIVPASSKFKHKLTYSFEGLTGTIVGSTTATAYNWVVPASFYARIPNAKYGICTITCKTYYGSDLLGSYSTDFKAVVHNSYPVISPSLTDTNTKAVELTGGTKYIKYYSNVAYDMRPQAKNSASLVSYKAVNGGTSIPASKGTFNAISADTFTFYCTDSRGFTREQTIQKPIVNYINLTCKMTVDMPTTDGKTTARITGNYFNNSFGKVYNTLRVWIRQAASGSPWGAWVEVKPKIQNNSYSVDIPYTGLDYTKLQWFECCVQDELLKLYSEQIKVKCVPVFDWGKEDFKFHTDVHMDNGTNLYGITTTGERVYSFEPCNRNNNCVVGYGGYAGSFGSTNIYGNNIRLTSNSLPTFNGWYIPQIQRGRAYITPSAPNTPTALIVKFNKAFSGVPTVIVSPRTTKIGQTVLGVATTDESTTQFTAWTTRTSTSTVGVGWLAIYN